MAGAPAVSPMEGPDAPGATASTSEQRAAPRGSAYEWVRKCLGLGRRVKQKDPLNRSKINSYASDSEVATDVVNEVRNDPWLLALLKYSPVIKEINLVVSQVKFVVSMFFLLLLLSNISYLRSSEAYDLGARINALVGDAGFGEPEATFHDIASEEDLYNWLDNVVVPLVWPEEISANPSPSTSTLAS